jgi:type IV pilus assembly protein PilO
MKLSIDLKKVTRLPKKYKIIIMVSICVVLFAAIFALLLMPQFKDKKAVASELASVRLDLKKLQDIRNNMDKTRREYAEMKDRLQQVLSQMPEQKDVPNLLRQVSTLSHETGARIRYFEPKAVQAKEFYSELPFELRYTGGYHNMGYFFDGIRRLERIVHVTSFSLEAKSVTATKVVLEGNCMAKTYVYAPAQQQPQKGKEATKK